jgi:hypothetical protein
VGLRQRSPPSQGQCHAVQRKQCIGEHESCVCVLHVRFISSSLFYCVISLAKKPSAATALPSNLVLGMQRSTFWLLAIVVMVLYGSYLGFVLKEGLAVVSNLVSEGVWIMCTCVCVSVSGEFYSMHVYPALFIITQTRTHTPSRRRVIVVRARRTAWSPYTLC